MHRALAHFRLGPMNVAASLALLVFFSAIWLSVLPRVCELWKRVLAWGVLVLPLHARIDVAERQFGFLHLKIPYLRLAAILPTLGVWSLTCFVTLLLYAATYLMPKNLTPVAYLSRGILIIQGSALVYFALWPIRFPHTPDQYMESLVTAMLALISVVPSLYALTYYIFDFGLWKKGSTHVDDHGVPGVVPAAATVAASPGAADYRPIHASALYCVRDADECPADYRVLFLGNDMVIPNGASGDSVRRCRVHAVEAV